MRYLTFTLLVLLVLPVITATGQQPKSSGNADPFAKSSGKTNPFDKSSGTALPFAKTQITNEANPPNQSPSVEAVQAGRRWLVAHQVSATVEFSRFNQVMKGQKRSICEDAAIMNQMIAKTLPLSNRQNALGVQVAQPYGINKIIYNDQGLKFVYHVPFPLMLGSVGPNNHEETAAPSQSPWQIAKAELEAPSANTNPIRVNGMIAAFIHPVPSPLYDQEKVDQLTELVRTALNNAGNIRRLDSDDMITVLVYGASSKPDLRTVKAWRVHWKSLKERKPGTSAVPEETTYEEHVGNPVTGSWRTGR